MDIEAVELYDMTLHFHL